MSTTRAKPTIAQRSHQYLPREWPSPLRASLACASWDTCYRLTVQVPPLWLLAPCACRCRPTDTSGRFPEEVLRLRYRNASTRRFRRLASGAQGRGMVVAGARHVRGFARGAVGVQAPRSDHRAGGTRVDDLGAVVAGRGLAAP